MNDKMTIKRVENTPFAVVEREDDKHIIVMGQHQACQEEFKSYEDAKTYIWSMQWDLIFNMAIIIAESYNDYKRNLKFKENGETNS